MKRADYTPDGDLAVLLLKKRHRNKFGWRWPFIGWQSQLAFAMMAWRGGRMTITVTLKDEVAKIVERQVAEGRYPDAESAVTAALMLLEDAAMNWGDIDADAVRRMIAESDAEDGEIPFKEIARTFAGRAPAPRR